MDMPGEEYLFCYVYEYTWYYVSNVVCTF